MSFWASCRELEQMLGKGKKDLIQLAAGPPLLAQRSLELDCSSKGLGESKEQTGCLLKSGW